MRPAVYAAWKSQIELEVAKYFSDFEPSTKRVRGESRGTLKYEWHPYPNLWCYIAFRPLDSEAFDALVGWSVHDRFPIADGSGQTQDLNDFESQSVMDWSLSFVPRSGTAHWNFWEPSSDIVDDPKLFSEAYMRHFSHSLTTEEASALVRPAIESGIAEVRDFGLPYLLRRVAYEAKKALKQ